MNPDTTRVEDNYVAPAGAAVVVEPWTRPCAVCNAEFPWDGVEYKNVCNNCYRTKTRSCSKCHVGTIKATAPSFHAVCTACWVESKRSKFYTPCPTCPPERATHLRRAPGQVFCAQCTAQRKAAKSS